MAAVYDLRTIGALIDNSSLVSAGELFVWMFVVGQFENIVDACVVKRRKLYQYFGGYVKIAALVIAVNALTAIQNLGEFPLL